MLVTRKLSVLLISSFTVNTILVHILLNSVSEITAFERFLLKKKNNDIFYVTGIIQYMIVNNKRRLIIYSV